MRPATWLAPGLVAVALLAALSTPGPAAAHAELRASEPAAGERLERAPGQVRLVLGAPVERAFLRLGVTGPDGAAAAARARRDPADPAAILAPLRPAGPGGYGVAWRALSQDGHPEGGTLSFAVGAGPLARPAAPDAPARRGAGPAGALGRLLLLAGPLGLLGLAVLRAGVAAGALRAGGVAAPGERPEAAEAFRARAGAAVAAAMRRWWAAWWGFAAAGAAGLALVPAATLHALGAGPGELGTLLADTRLGRALLVQAAALALAAGAALALGRGGSRAEPAIPPAWGLALGVPPAAALVAISWSGHASSHGDRTLNIAIDALHNGATAAWLGTLAGLLALLPAAGRRLEATDRVRLAAGVVVRVSALAIAAVSLLVVTGTYRALVELSGLGDLTGTGYGRVLLVKLVLFALLLLGGAYNRLVLHPRLERAALGLDPDDRGAAAALRASVSAELAVAAGLLAAVAALISLPPPA